MAIPTWTVGEVLTASDVNTYFVPKSVVKPSNQSVTSSTVLVNDTALVLAMDANASYDWELSLSYVGGTLGASDLKFAFTAPAGATGAFNVNGSNAAGNDISRLGWTLASPGGLLGTEGATLRSAVFSGSITTVGTAGNLQFQFAQNTSSGTATTVNSGSFMRLQRIS